MYVLRGIDGTIKLGIELRMRVLHSIIFEICSLPLAPQRHKSNATSFFALLNYIFILYCK